VISGGDLQSSGYAERLEMSNYPPCHDQCVELINDIARVD
jgi:hypothetical protein